MHVDDRFSSRVCLLGVINHLKAFPPFSAFRLFCRRKGPRIRGRERKVKRVKGKKGGKCRRRRHKKCSRRKKRQTRKNKLFAKAPNNSPRYHSLSVSRGTDGRRCAVDSRSIVHSRGHRRIEQCLAALHIHGRAVIVVIAATLHA